MNEVHFPITLSEAARLLSITPTEVSVTVRVLRIATSPSGRPGNAVMIGEAGYARLREAAALLQTREARKRRSRP